MKNEKENTPNEIAQVSAEIAGGTVGTGLGLLIGGPPGALIGAAAGPVAVKLGQLAISKSTRFWKTFDHLLKNTNIDEEALIADLEINTEKAVSLERIFRAAMEAVGRDHVDILAAAAIETLKGNNGRANLIATLCEIISSLTPLHIAVLTKISSSYLNQELPNETPETLLSQFENEASLLRYIVRSLELSGLILDEGRLDSSVAEISWEMSELGLQTLEVLNGEILTDDAKKKDV